MFVFQFGINEVGAYHIAVVLSGGVVELELEFNLAFNVGIDDFRMLIVGISFNSNLGCEGEVAYLRTGGDAASGGEFTFVGHDDTEGEGVVFV